MTGRRPSALRGGFRFANPARPSLLVDIMNGAWTADGQGARWRQAVRWWRRLGGVLGMWVVGTVAACGASPTNWVDLLTERFETPVTDRFRILPVPRVGTTSSGGSCDHDAAGKSSRLSGWMQLVQPVKAGPQVALEMDLKFETPEASSIPEGVTNLVSAFQLVLVDRTVAGFEVWQPRTGDGPVRVKLVTRSERDVEGRELKDVEWAGALEGTWRLEYRRGLVVVRKGGVRLLAADLERPGIPVAGVVWMERGGKVACRRLVLSGEPLRQYTEVESERLREAAQLNEDAQRLARTGRAEDAIPKMRQASALFVKVLGEQHPDSGNSFANLASMLDLAGNGEQADRYWVRALAVHEATLGADHPAAILTRFNYGKHLFDAGRTAEAKREWTRCRDDWQELFGPDYPLVKSISGILGRL